MGLPTKTERLALGYVHGGAPSVRVPSNVLVRTQTLEYPYQGAAFAAVDVPVALTNIPCGSGPPYAAIESFISAPTPGAYFWGLGTGVSRLVFPSAGGVGDWAIRFWLRRPITPIAASGVLMQVACDLARLTVTINIDSTLTVAITDGTVTESTTTTAPIIGMEWTAITLAHDSGSQEVSVYTGTLADTVIDTSSLTVPATEVGRYLSIMADVQGDNGVDADIAGWAAFETALLSDHVAVLESEGESFHVGNPSGNGSVWDGSIEPQFYYIEPAYEGGIPNAGCGVDTEGDVLIPRDGAITEGLILDEPESPEPEPTTGTAYCGMRGFGSPSSLGSWSIPRNAGFGSPSGGSYRDTGFGSPALGFERAGTCNPPSFIWVPMSLGVPDHVFADEGGELVSLVVINDRFPSRGPYKVRLIDANGIYWPRIGDGCYSARASGGTDCQTNASREILRFALPPLPEGIYDVEVSWDNVYRVTSEDSILIVYRNSIREFDSLVNSFA